MAACATPTACSTPRARRLIARARGPRRRPASRSTRWSRSTVDGGAEHGARRRATTSSRAPASARRPAARVADLGPPEHAVGRHRAVGRARSTPTARSAARAASPAARRVDLPAEWSPDGELHFVSDRTGWWNLYRERGGAVEALWPIEAEFGEPQWVFGMRTYGFDGAGRIVCTYPRRRPLAPGAASTRASDLARRSTRRSTTSATSARRRRLRRVLRRLADRAPRRWCGSTCATRRRMR